VEQDLELTPRMAAVVKIFLRDVAEPQFGFDLMQQLRISAGTLYPLLTRLRRAGWLAAETEDIDPKIAGRPARRYYTLTPGGAVAAVRALQQSQALYEVPPIARRVGRPGLARGTT
jgi:PadR family transcriptional regulator, regulatory protein PadR